MPYILTNTTLSGCPGPGRCQVITSYPFSKETFNVPIVYFLGSVAPLFYFIFILYKLNRDYRGALTGGKTTRVLPLYTTFMQMLLLIFLVVFIFRFFFLKKKRSSI